MRYQTALHSADFLCNPRAASRVLIVKADACGKAAFRLFVPRVTTEPPRATRPARDMQLQAVSMLARRATALVPSGTAGLLSRRASARRCAVARVARQELPLYGPRPPVRRRVGASPSGKAADFDSAMRRFESSRPSHAFASSADFVASRAGARIPQAFAGAETADRSARALRRPNRPTVCNADLAVSEIS